MIVYESIRFANRSRSVLNEGNGVRFEGLLKGWRKSKDNLSSEEALSDWIC